MKKALLVVGLSMFLAAANPPTWADPPGSSGSVIRLSDSGDMCLGVGDPLFCCLGVGEGFCTDFATISFDADKGLFALVGGDLPLFEAWCVASEDTIFETVQSQWVLSPHEADLIIQAARQPDRSTLVYKIEPVCPGGLTFDAICCHITTFPPLATGKVNAIYTDNNLFAVDTTRTRIFGWTYHGVLTKDTGQRAIFNSQTRCQRDLGGIGVCFDFINLH